METENQDDIPERLKYLDLDKQFGLLARLDRKLSMIVLLIHFCLILLFTFGSAFTMEDPMEFYITGLFLMIALILFVEMFLLLCYVNKKLLKIKKEKDDTKELAGIFYKNKDYANAIKVYEKIVPLLKKSLPKTRWSISFLTKDALAEDALLCSRLGHAYAQEENHASAAGAFEHAVRLQPSDQADWRNLGITRKKLGEYPRALQAFQEALKLEPSDVKVKYNQADVLLQMGSVPQAMSILRDIMKDSSVKMKDWEYFASELERSGLLREAIEINAGITALDPEHAPAWKQLGMLYTRVDPPDLRNALLNLETYTEFDSDDQEVNDAIARVKKSLQERGG